MVERERIEEILDNIISNINTKCGPTIAEMHEILSSMSIDEQFKQLKEKGLLNPFEEEDYLHCMGLYDWASDDIGLLIDKQHPRKNKDRIALKERYIEELPQVFFQYGRRLIEGNKNRQQKEPPSIDKENYIIDKQLPKGTYDNNHTMGDLESEYVLSQKQTLNDISDKVLTPKIKSMDAYFNGDAHELSRTIYGKNYSNKLDKQQEKDIRNIDYLMNKSPGLDKDTILYRGGNFDINLRVGDTGKWKAYTSTTFQHEIAESFIRNHNHAFSRTVAVKYVIHAPKGTKGISGNDKTFKNGFGEHEFVLPRNQKFTVLDIDYENNVVEIVLE